MAASNRGCYRLHDNRVIPLYLREDDQVWLRALLDEAHRFEGRPRRALRERLEEPLAAPAPPEKLALALPILERRFSAPPSGPRRPRRLRAELFRAAAATENREQAVAEVARAFQLAPDELIDALFSDVPDERRLQAPEEPLSPTELQLRTNLELVQSLLSRSTSVVIDLLGNARAVVRLAHVRGLLCDVREERVGELYRISVSGPYALFKRTRLYGRALAGLLPVLKRCHRFRLQATVCLAEGRASLVVASGDPIFPAALERPYDSRLEERFARDFARAAPDWDLIREPRPVKAGRSLVFPDFELRHRPSGRSRLLEIVGFWTPEYLAQKLARYRLAGLLDLILCVDAERACEEADLPRGAALVAFKRRIDPKAVLAVLDGDG